LIGNFCFSCFKDFSERRTCFKHADAESFLDTIEKLFILYFHSYETSDGVSRQEEAEVKNLGTDFETLNVRGSVSYTAGDF
jgi:Insect cuticle protein